MKINAETVSKAIGQAFTKNEIETFENNIKKDLCYFIDNRLLLVGMLILDITKFDDYLIMLGMPEGTSMKQYLIQKYGKENAKTIEKMFCDTHYLIKN